MLCLCPIVFIVYPWVHEAMLFYQNSHFIVHSQSHVTSLRFSFLSVMAKVVNTNRRDVTLWLDKFMVLMVALANLLRQTNHCYFYHYPVRRLCWIDKYNWNCAWTVHGNDYSQACYVSQSLIVLLFNNSNVLMMIWIVPYCYCTSQWWLLLWQAVISYTSDAITQSCRL